MEIIYVLIVFLIMGLVVLGVNKSRAKTKARIYEQAVEAAKEATRLDALKRELNRRSEVARTASENNLRKARGREELTSDRKPLSTSKPASLPSSQPYRSRDYVEHTTHIDNSTSLLVAASLLSSENNSNYTEPARCDDSQSSNDTPSSYCSPSSNDDSSSSSSSSSDYSSSSSSDYSSSSDSGGGGSWD
jgi:uncharacterized membrane protein YgcG